MFTVSCLLLCSLRLNLSVMGSGFHRFITPSFLKPKTHISSKSNTLSWRGGGGDSESSKVVKTSKKLNKEKKNQRIQPKKVEKKKTQERAQDEQEIILLQLGNSSTSLPHNVIELSDEALSKLKISEGDLVCLKGKRRSSSLAVAKRGLR
jgi:hypothetical protein